MFGDTLGSSMAMPVPKKWPCPDLPSGPAVMLA